MNYYRVTVPLISYAICAGSISAAVLIAQCTWSNTRRMHVERIAYKPIATEVLC